jgi:hypothetical protein
VLDPVVFTEVREVKRVFTVAFVEHPGTYIWNEVAKGGCEIVCSADGPVHLYEADITAIARKDACFS